MLEANYLSILMKPNYEKAIDSSQDILDRGMKVIYPYGYESIVEMLKNSPSNITRELAERTIVAKVIFCSNYSFLNVSERIGIMKLSWLKMRLLMALLFMKFPFFTISS